jgi:uncharacterized protein
MARREDVTFSSEDGVVAAWFYAPRRPSGLRSPCVVLGHGFAGVKEARLDAFADAFSRAGFACLVFDYRHLGASSGTPRQLISLSRHRADWRAAIAYASARPDVDPGRIALWGTSLGGGLVLELAARLPQVRCAVVQGPLVDTFATSAAEAPGHMRKVTLAVVRDLARAVLRRRPYTIPVVGPYGSLAFMTAPEAEPGYMSIVRNAHRWRNEVTARTALALALFRPARRAADIPCPLLVITGDADQITPREVTLRALRSVENATFASYAGGHFDGYLGDGFSSAVAAAVSFLERTLLDGRVASGSGPPAA